MTPHPRMPQPRKALSELLSKDGDRVFTLTEKQFFGIVNGWTHLELMDEKSIFESIYDTRTSRPAPSPEQCNAESFRAIIEQNRAEAAAQAREKALDDAISAVESVNINDVEDARDAIESLRTEAHK